MTPAFSLHTDKTFYGLYETFELAQLVARTVNPALQHWDARNTDYEGARQWTCVSGRKEWHINRYMLNSNKAYMFFNLACPKGIILHGLEFAKTYSGQKIIEPWAWDDALKEWQATLEIASNEVEIARIYEFDVITSTDLALLPIEDITMTHDMRRKRDLGKQ